ncbi:MAG: alpha-hydroxy-acid oxidizing protein, partial [Nitrososphaerales archaeon]
IQADALAIHLNPLQEVIQPEGEPKFRGVLGRIKDISEELRIPIIVKEVGAGISPKVALRLERSGVAAINVAGLGGTSWAGVEQIRAEGEHVDAKARLGDLLWDWGIPTAASLILARRAVVKPLISSGGLRNGVDVAKCIALGANIAGLAHPMLKHAAESLSSLVQFMEETIDQVRATMFLVGAKDIQALSGADYVITGLLRDWIDL